ncbi:nuclear transport factor 2 family protein [Microbispora rosea]|uniref:nuclear transport factor 2 family protein n=1 Tax=Microbispora rosea TaxID=58117 RepID=UPI00343FFD06
MTSMETPRPIVAFLDATNAADPDAFVAAFTEDAFLDDWGRQYRGHEGVRDWDRTDNIGVQSRIALTALTSGSEPDTFIGTVAVSGNRFNGTGTMTFTLRDDRISSLVIG